MDRYLPAALLVYVPHLVEEHVTRMCDDPLIVAAFRPLEDLPARRSSYLVFQAMLLAALTMTWLFSLGGRWRAVVMGALGLALLAEAHHLIRAATTFHYNSGLATALPMPIVGALILRALVR
jgi:hypothetical protein